jgi:ferredoxin
MSDLPRMPQGEAGSEPPGPDTLIRFHLTGEGADAAQHGLRPALSAALLGPERRWQHYPLVLLEADDSTDAGKPVVPLSALIAQALQAMSEGGEPTHVLTDQIPRLARAVEQVLNHGGAGTPLREVLDVARERFVGEFDLSEAGEDALRQEIEKLEAALPRAGTVFAPGWRALLELYASAIRRERRPAETRFLDEVQGLVMRLSDLLEIDTSHSPEGKSSQALSGGLGEAGGELFDTEALAHLLPEDRGPKRLAPERRARIEEARAALVRHLRHAETDPQLVIVHSGDWPSDLALPRVELVEAGEASGGLAGAAAAFDEHARRMAEVLRAARVARLEIDGDYEPERHDRALDRFDWRSVRPDELRLFPQVVVLERADRVRRSGVAELSALLRSGRPVHALLLEQPLPQPVDELETSHLEIGYLAASHHEAFVLQSTLAQPEHLGAGFARMAGSSRTAVAVVAVPSGDSELPPPVELAVAHEARATPCFRFDPACGDSWAACFDLDANPQIDRAWPVHELRYLNEAGEEVTRVEAFTFAHATAMHPAFGRHFRPVARQHWSDDQVEIADYLSRDEAGRHHKLPFIWTVDDERRLTRVVMTHELAEACRARSKTWRIFRELAGVDSEHALRAAKQARSDAEAKAEEARLQLVKAHEEEVERIREGSGQEALERLVNVLMDIESAPGMAALPAAEAPVGESPAVADEPAAEAAEAAEEVAEDEALVLDEPYIDSVLCTTCNECTNLNGQLFKYNENKQAYIADASAGTFEQLVKAAEKCPARCIHPGAPREGDATVTDALRKRAAKFN